MSIISLVLFMMLPGMAHAQTLAERLSGRILLQVQSHGEAWYVDPVQHARFSLGRAEDAYALMRSQGLGIRHAELTRYLAGYFPARLAGRILLDVESHGEAYYILPTTLRGVSLGRAADAYALMRQYGLGITNQDLTFIPIAHGPVLFPSPYSPPAPTPELTTPYRALEQAAFDQINAYRQSKGLSTLTWNEEIAKVARQHSIDMANGSVAFGHGGFSDRAALLQQKMSLRGLAENVAYNDYPDPATTSVTGWIASEGHRLNIENNGYSLSGMGVAQSSDGAYYFTQLFLAP